MVALRKKLRHLKPGSEAYLDLVSELAVSATAVKIKADTLLCEIDTVEDALPDEDT